MFFGDLIRRRLASLLRPWLREEPDLELKLGFLRSNGTVKNLNFKTSALNQLLDDSSPFRFKEVTVQQLSLRVSYWSSPAFTLIVGGLHFTLGVGEEEEEGGGVRRRRKPTDTSVEDKKEVLTEIDPEGVVLHDAVEKISSITAGSWTTNLVTTVLRYSQLQVDDIHVLLLPPISDNSFSCLLEFNELGAEPDNIAQTCFLGGFISSFFLPSQKCSFDIDIGLFESVLRSKNVTTTVVCSTNISSSIALQNLGCVNFLLCFPELRVSVSPEGLGIITLFYLLSVRKSKHFRTGRQLWRIAASKVRSMIPSCKFSMQKVICSVRLWLHYRHSYEDMLLLIGYPVDDMIKKSAAKMTFDKAYSKSIRHHWGIISEFEKELPPEAIAQARRISRCRASGNAQLANHHCDKPPTSRLLWRIYQLPALIWSIACHVLQSIIQLFSCLKILGPFTYHPKIDRQHRVACDDSPTSCICLDVGSFTISVSPENRVQPPVEGLSSAVRFSSEHLAAFHLSSDALFLRYFNKLTEDSLILSCGCIKIVSSSLTEVGSHNDGSLLGKNQKKKVHDSQTILWCEPAQIYASEDHISDNEGESIPLLEFILERMWMNWKKIYATFCGNDGVISETPCVLFERRHFLIDRRSKNLTSGLCDVGIVVGRLNFALEYHSVVSLAVVFGQTWHTLCWVDNRKGMNAVSNPATTIKGLPINSNSKYESLPCRVETRMLRMFPQKHMEIGVNVAGPKIELSLGKERVLGGNADLCLMRKNDDLWLSFDLDDIEFVLSPKLESDFALSSGYTVVCDLNQSNNLGLDKPQNAGILKSTNEIHSTCEWISLSAYLRLNGLKLYLGKLSDNSRHQFVRLSPVTIWSTALRKDLRSLGSTVIDFSAALHWMATGVSAKVVLDELLVLAEAVSNLKVVILDALAYFSLDGGQSYQGLLKHQLTYVYSESQEMFPNKGTEASFLSINAHFGFKNTCELKSVNMVLYHSRKSCNTENYLIQIDATSSRNQVMDRMLEYGLHMVIQQTCLLFSFDGGIAELAIDFSGFRCIIAKYYTEIVERFDDFDPRSLLQSANCLCEASVSHCKLSLSLSASEKALSLERWRNEVDASTSGRKSCTSDDSLTKRKTERSGDHSSHWLCMNIFLGEIYLVDCSVKDILVKKNQSKKLDAYLCVGGQYQRIFCQSQGGSIYVETTSLLIFVQCVSLFCRRINDGWHVTSPNKLKVVQGGETVVDLDSNHAQDFQQLQKAEWNQLELFGLSLSQPSLALVARDESGRLLELLFEADVHLNLDVQNTRRKISFDVSKFSIVSQFLNETLEQTAKEIQIPHFSSVTSTNSSSTYAQGDPSVAAAHGNLVCSVLDDSGCTSYSVPQSDLYTGSSNGSCTYGIRSKFLRSRHQNYILRELCAYFAVECPITMDESDAGYLKQVWVGNGSLSGFDMILSLTEIQVILSAVESLSGILVEEKVKNMNQRHESMSQESEGSLGEKLPDGTIVAIGDVYHHLYIAVEDAESSGYNLVGSIHYSLVGERSLFRVKYHTPGRWKPQAQYFSLISLYAKDASGESLRLNCRGRSDFVEISGSYDSAETLWSILPCKSEAYDGYSEWESFEPPAKNTFHLVNKKNDRAIAFVNGVLEFVMKPGNPFKLKVFHDFIPAGNGLFTDNSSPVEPGSGLPCHSQANDRRNLENTTKLQGFTVIINKITLTIVHELADTEEKLPLLKGSINSTEIIVQMLNTKARFMSRIEIMIQQFDAQRNLWRELVHPLDIWIFYRYSFLNQNSGNVMPRVQYHFHASLKELSISLSELSLDILLFVIGKLKLAGPFAVRSSAILANSCKVENQSGLILHCQFFDNQYASVAGRQSTTIFLRHLALSNQPPEAAVFSIQLRDQGALLTSEIRLSLLEARSFAWRTRVVSSQESRTSPGSFIVIEVSQRTEDGLSIIVSPLLRIHNETDFSMELRFQRPQQRETEFASLVLDAGDSFDDSMAAFGATNFSGGLKKALVSLSSGNFLFSFRPRITDGLQNFVVTSVEWSDDLKGGKPVRLSGVFDKLSYQFRTAFSFESMKCALSTAHCTLMLEGGHIAHIYFLIQTIGKEVPVIRPDNFENAPAKRNPPIALQEQKEIFLLPTVHVSNLLHTEIHVNLTERDPMITLDYDNLCSQATIPCGAAVNLYANPATIFFTFTLTAFGPSCKPVNTTEWVKKLQKQKNNSHHLDIELDFGGGKYFAFLRLLRGQRGVLEAVIFTSYALQNDTNFSLCCFPTSRKPLSRDEVENLCSRIPPEIGAYLPPKSTSSWFLKHHKIHVKLVEEKASEALLDLGALSGLTELNLEVEEKSGVKTVTKLGVSLKPSSKPVQSQTVYMRPRHVVLNQSEEAINLRQCYLGDDSEGIITLSSKQRTALKLQKLMREKGEMTIVDKLLKKHTRPLEDPLLFIQFRPIDASLGWSGPVCVASLGQFFLKFRRLESHVRESDCKTMRSPSLWEFAAVHVVEKDSTLLLHFYRPPNVDLPYRIENCLQNAPITYYQKGSMEPEILGSGRTADYVWDDLTLPHKLVVQIEDIHLFREINLDKVREWKPFYGTKQQRGMGFLLLDKKPGDKEATNHGQSISSRTAKWGYEVYAEGLTRVLRICEFSDSQKGDAVLYSTSKMRLRVSYFALELLECAKEERDMGEASVYTPIIVARFENIHMLSVFTHQHKVNQISVQSLAVDQKWIGAPFAAILREHHSEYHDTNDNVLQVVLVLFSSTSMVKQIKYLSIILQPLDLNLDEETLLRLASFWRTSLSDPKAPSQLYYFEHFEIHPVKIIASFLPRDSYANYSSTQEMLRSFLHSVIKIPTIKKKTVELNGVLVAHALITLRELSIKCAQHFSWYALRAVYIAKGSPLLPPAFASIFDDFASSSLDVFFDPSSGLNLPGLTMGTFKLISKHIKGKGFSGTKRYFGDLGKTLKLAGSNLLFAAVTEISDTVLRGAETSGVDGMVRGFHQGILNLAMEPTLLGNALIEGGPDRKIRLDRTPGVDELYIEGYLQAMLDTLYKQEYLRVRVIDNQIILKNLPPNSSLINEITERVKSFLISKALLKGDSSSASHSLRHIRGESEWRIGPTLLTLCEHLFVSFAIRALRKQAGKVITRAGLKEKLESSNKKAVATTSNGEEQKVKLVWRWGIGKFVLSGIVAYVDGRLCRCIPNPIARRVVSGFLLSFLDNEKE